MEARADGLSAKLVELDKQKDEVESELELTYTRISSFKEKQAEAQRLVDGKATSADPSTTAALAQVAQFQAALAGVLQTMSQVAPQAVQALPAEV